MRKENGKNNRVALCCFQRVFRLTVNDETEMRDAAFSCQPWEAKAYSTDDNLKTGDNSWVASGQLPVCGFQISSLDRIPISLPAQLR